MYKIDVSGKADGNCRQVSCCDIELYSVCVISVAVIISNKRRLSRICLHFVMNGSFLCSQTGKKLMAKCRMLIQENQELGRQLSQGRIAQLEAELALQKKYSEELKSSQDGKGSFEKFG